MTKEALTLAIEALEAALSDDQPYIVKCEKAITAIKQALAQTQEPVACAECERLNGELKKANDRAEHFEREWYLRGDEIERLKAQPQEPDDIASILACRDMLDAQPVPPRTTG